MRFGRNAMKKHKRIQILRWIARAVGLVFVGTLLLFFIGEKIWDKMNTLTWLDILLLLCILFFMIGVFLGFWRELWGGIVIIASIFAFNIIDIIASASFEWQFQLWFLLIPGILYLINYFLSLKKQKNEE